MSSANLKAPPAGKREDSDAASGRSLTGPLSRWHADHRNFALLLDLVQRQVDAFHAHKRMDYELMHSIVYYLRHFPDRFHHPREDVAFARMIEHDPRMQLEIARRIQEHVVIAEAGEQLLSCLNAIIAGVVVERSALEAAAATYLVYYRYHLACEEQQVIPRAVELLTAADWAAVAAIASEPDPLFGSGTDHRYEALRKQIAAMAEDEA